MMQLFWLGLCAYCLGSVTFGPIICRIFDAPDPRAQGSSNPGATNVLRVAGTRLALLVLLGDFLKGVLAVIIARYWQLDILGLSVVAFCVFFGHLYPIFFQFKGGKGVATMIGALLALSPMLGICFMLVWLLVLAMMRYSSLSAIVAAIVVPVVAYWSMGLAVAICVMAMSVFLIERHKGNIQRLFLGTEPKIGARHAHSGD